MRKFEKIRIIKSYNIIIKNIKNRRNIKKNENTLKF